jgi:cytochrome c oxidase subunit II
MSATNSQSVLHPASGSAAERIDVLGDVVHWGGALMFAVVVALAVYAALSGPKSIRARRWIVVGGLAMPALVLAALFGLALATGNALHAFDEPPVQRIHVTGRQWWWEVRYEDASGEPSIALANEVHLPAGRPVELLVSTGDVIHSFWAPAVAGKVDMIPGRTNRLVVEAAGEGVFRGQCAEYCGAQHALMAFDVVVEEEGRFEAWLAAQAQPVRVADDPAAARGLALFFRGGCAACHTIRGTAAAGTIGPDLTHVGSRRTLAAGLLRNHAGTMGGWIAGAQELKPGSAMPNTLAFTGAELREISGWLASLQ